MSPEHGEELYAKKEENRRSIVDSLIERSKRGDINWDFSLFDDSFCGKKAATKCGGMTVDCRDWQDTGVEVTIIEEKGEDGRSIDYFKGKEAMRLRKFLQEQALLDWKKK